MGAEPWSVRVPYQPDLERALADAQRETFARGDYQKPWADVSFLEDTGLFEADAEEQQDILSLYGLDPLRSLIAEVGVSGLRLRLRQLNDAPRWNSLDEVRALNCLYTDGTASVLDVARVADARGSGVAYLLPPDELFRRYGTDRPTCAQVEGLAGLYDDIGRGEAVCLVLYEAEHPAEVLFAGYSYD